MREWSGIGSNVDRTAIDSSARILGQSLVEGARTRIGRAAHIENSYLKNVVVEPGARIVDSVVVGEPPGPNEEHAATGAAAKWSIRRPYPVTVGEDADLVGCTVTDASVGPRSRCRSAFLAEGSIGPDSVVTRASAYRVHGLGHVRIEGPTELSDAWLGHHTHIDRCGYFEGVFSNDFHVVEFDRKACRLIVKETLDVPHVSRYGLHAIHSTNSGRLKDPKGGRLKSLGGSVDLWHDALLSHDPVILGPCCWVAAWTKVIGGSAALHDDAELLLMDSLATHLQPFSVSGLGGESVSGQVMPGELSNGLSYKQRNPAWVFDHAPDAVMAMVRRVAHAMGDTALADRLVELALRNALALVEYTAAKRGTNLDATRDRRPTGWTGWLVRARSVLQQHLESGLWEFRGAEPVAWRRTGGKWMPTASAIGRLPNEKVLEEQVSDEDLTACDSPDSDRPLGVSEESLARTTAPSFVDPEATVGPGAFIGPGVRILGKSRVEQGAWLYRTVVENSSVGVDARIARSSLVKSDVGAGVDMASSSMVRSTLGANSSAHCTRIHRSVMAERATLRPYADLDRTTIRHPCIMGTPVADTEVDSTFMSYHMPGRVEHLVVEPSTVERSGSRVTVHTIGMLGGGAQVLGRPDAAVRMECAFIGSNAVLEAGSYVGFGSFVLGRLTGTEGLPPLTISTAPGPERDQVGMVVHRMANVVITHFINWAYQALGLERADDVGQLVTSYLCEGRAAVQWALSERGEEPGADTPSPFAKYRSLRLYSEDQLRAGLRAYESALADGRWEMACRDGRLQFTGNGAWVVNDGVARWHPEGSGTAKE